MIDVEYRAPTELTEVTDILTEHGAAAAVLAGGTALLLQMKRRPAGPRVLVDLHRVPGLARISEDGTGLRLGATTTLRELENSPLVAARLPGLRQAVAQVATIRLRNQATIGGSLAQGDPLMDLPAVLTALDGSVALSSSQGSRTIRLADFFVDHLTTAARPGEIITEVRVPFLPPHSAAVYYKFLPRTATDYGVVAVAARLSLNPDGERVQDLRIALAGAGPTTVRALGAEALVRGRRAEQAIFADAAAAVRSSISPRSDSRGSAHYKQHMAEVFVQRTLQRALEQARRTPGQT